MKKIYITEDKAREISSLLKPIEDLPYDIKNVLKNHKTSLGIHPSFPPEEEISFDALITQKHFNEIKHKISELNLENYSRKFLQKYLQELIDYCKKIEKNFKGQLENICYNYIIDLFQVPEGLVAFDCHLVEIVNTDKAPIKNKETIEFNDIKHRTVLHDAVYKRRMINAIITGGASRLSSFSKSLIGELYELCPELPLIYKKIKIINDYLLFTKNNTGISEQNKKQSGISYLTIGNSTTKNKLIIEAEIFPILLHESIRGFLEMFAAYGLPSSKKDCSYVISKADFINAEPWDMRMGPILWDYLMSAFNDPDSQTLPMLLTILFSQRTEKFNIFLQEIFGETKKGKLLAQKILDKTNKELEYDDFEELMHKKQTDTAVINDNYYLPEEL